MFFVALFLSFGFSKYAYICELRRRRRRWQWETHTRKERGKKYDNAQTQTKTCDVYRFFWSIEWKIECFFFHLSWFCIFIFEIHISIVRNTLEDA